MSNRLPGFEILGHLYIKSMHLSNGAFIFQDHYACSHLCSGSYISKTMKVISLHKNYVSSLSQYNCPIFQMIRMNQRNALPGIWMSSSSPFPWPSIILPVKAHFYKMVNLMGVLVNKTIIIAFILCSVPKVKTDYICVRNWLWKHTHTQNLRFY